MTGLFLGIASIFDIRKKRIPLLYMVGCGLVSIAYSMLILHAYGIEIVLNISIGIIMTMVSLLSGEKLGYADGICVMIVGLLCGFIRCMYIVFGASLFCLIFSVIGLILKKIDRNTKLPFLPFLAFSWGVISIAL